MATAEFSKFAGILSTTLSQHHLSGFEIAQLDFHHLSHPQLVVVLLWWCLRRLLGVLWTARRLNQSILKEISPEYSLEGLMVKLEFQYFGHRMQGTDSFEKTLILRKTEGGRRKGCS